VPLVGLQVPDWQPIVSPVAGSTMQSAHTPGPPLPVPPDGTQTPNALDPGWYVLNDAAQPMPKLDEVIGPSLKH
jgi:hypothetical protein